MPRSINVRDYNVRVNFPDGVSDEEIQRVLRENYPNKKIVSGGMQPQQAMASEYPEQGVSPTKAAFVGLRDAPPPTSSRGGTVPPVQAPKETGATLGGTVRSLPGAGWSGLHQAGQSISGLGAGFEAGANRLLAKTIDDLPEFLKGAELQYAADQARERAQGLQEKRAQVAPWQEQEEKRVEQRAKELGGSTFVARNVAGGVRSLSESLVFAPGGPAAMIGGTGLMSIDRTFEDAEREGLSPQEKWERISSSAVSDVVIPTLFQSIGLGGFEDIFSPAKQVAAKTGVLAGTKRVLGRLGAEQLEETSSFVNDMITESRWNPEGLNPDEVFKAYADMATQVAVAQGGGEITAIPSRLRQRGGQQADTSPPPALEAGSLAPPVDSTLPTEQAPDLRSMATPKPGFADAMAANTRASVTKGAEGRAQRAARRAEDRRFDNARALVIRPIETLTPSELVELQGVIALGRERAQEQGKEHLVPKYDDLANEYSTYRYEQALRDAVEQGAVLPKETLAEYPELWMASMSNEMPTRVPGLTPPMDATLPTEQAPDLRGLATPSPTPQAPASTPPASAPAPQASAPTPQDPAREAYLDRLEADARQRYPDQFPERGTQEWQDFRDLHGEQYDRAQGLVGRKPAPRRASAPPQPRPPREPLPKQPSMTPPPPEDMGVEDAPPGPPDATKNAQELAASKGIALETVTGTGRNGRITKKDVEKVADTLDEEKARGRFIQQNRVVVSEGDDALKAFREMIKRGGIRPPEGGMTYEDFGGRFPPGVIKRDGAYTWDQAVLEAADMGLIERDANPTELRALFLGSAKQEEVREFMPEDVLDQMKRGRPTQVNEADIKPGSLVFKDGEWHRAAPTEDGTVLEDGERTYLDAGQETTAQAVVPPGDDLHLWANKEYAAQERGKLLSPETQQAIEVYGDRVVPVLESQRAALKKTGQSTAQVDQILGELTGTASSMQGELFTDPDLISPSDEDMARQQKERQDEALLLTDTLPGLNAESPVTPMPVELGEAFFSQPNPPYTPALLNEPEAACEECDSVARDFEAFAEEQGVEVEPVTVLGRKAPLGDDAAQVMREQVPGDIEHTVLRMPDGTYLDMTSAQFGSEYSGIRILTEEGLRSEWSVIGPEPPSQGGTAPEPSAADTIKRAAQRRKTEATGRAGILEDISSSMSALEGGPVPSPLTQWRAEKQAEQQAQDAQENQMGAVRLPPPRRRETAPTVRYSSQEANESHRRGSGPIERTPGWRKVLRAFRTVGNMTFREHRRIPGGGPYRSINEMFSRHKKATPAVVQRGAQDIVKTITHPISRIKDRKRRANAHDLFDRMMNLVYAIEMMEGSTSPDYADIAPTLKNAFGFEPSQVEADLDRLTGIMREFYPEVEVALQNRYEAQQAITDMARKMGLIPDDATDKWYHHFAVMRYMKEDNFGRQGHTSPVRAQRRGPQKKRKDRSEAWAEDLTPSTNFFVYETIYYMNALAEYENRAFLLRLQGLTGREQGHLVDGQPIQEEYVDYPANPKTMFANSSNVETLPEQGMNAIADELGLNDEERAILQMTQAESVFRFPKSVADTLNAMRPLGKGHQASDLIGISRTVNRIVRRLYLHVPWRIASYVIRNGTSDWPVAIAMAPSTLRHVPSASKQVMDWHFKGGMSEAVEAAMRNGVMQGGAHGAIELSEANYTDMRESMVDFAKEQRKGKGVGQAATSLWKATKEVGAAPVTAAGVLEDTPRLAAFLHRRKQLASGKPIRYYGSSNPKTVQSIKEHMGVDAAAAHMARRDLGDYSYQTEMGQLLRNFVPFWGFVETVFRRLSVQSTNIVRGGDGEITVTQTDVDPETGEARETVVKRHYGTMALNRALGLASMTTPHLLLQAWNNLVMDDVEEELSTWQRIQPHINLRYSENGNHIVFNGVGMIADLQDMLGVTDLRRFWPYFEAGQMDAADVAAEMGRGMLGSMFNRVQPLVTGTVGAVTGQNFFPDPTNPRAIDRQDAMANMLGVRREAAMALDGQFPPGAGKGPWDNYMLSLVSNLANRDQAKLSKAYEHLEVFKKMHGIESPQWPSDLEAEARSTMKRAVLYDDKAMFNAAKTRYLEVGGTQEDLWKYLGQARRKQPRRQREGIGKQGAFNPLDSLPSNKAREAFYEWATTEQIRDVEEAGQIAARVRDTILHWWYD